MNKRGMLPVIETLIVGIMVFILVIGISYVFNAFSTVATDLQASDSIPTVSKTQLSMLNDRIPQSMSNLIVVVFFGSFIALIVAALFTRSHMVFLFVAIILVAVFSFVMAVLSNSWAEMYDAGDVTYKTFVTTQMALPNHIMNNYVMYIVVLTICVVIALFAKTSGNAGSGI